MSLFTRKPTLTEAVATVHAQVLATPPGDPLPPPVTWLAQALRERGVDLVQGEPPPRLQELFDAIPDPIGLLGSDGRVCASNTAFSAVLGHNAHGRTLLEATRSGDLTEAVGRALDGKSSSSPIQLPAQQRVFHVTLVPLPRGRALLLMRDLSATRRVESVRRDFIANASHELRTPVAAISGAVETLLSGPVQLDATARTFVEMIARHAARLSRLSRDLLDLSRLESGERAVKLAPLDLRAASANAIDLISPRAAPKGIGLALEVPEGLTAEAEPRALEQVLINLLDNAIKYTPAGGSVKLRGEPGEGSATLSVIDNGPGIEAHHQERIFERFYRIDGGRSRDEGGTGLGLAIVKHLVLAQGGEIGVQSGEGGSRFWVRLKAAAVP